MTEQKEFQMQVEGLLSDVLQILVIDDGYSLIQALDYLYLSKTCKVLERPETGLYYESPVYVWDCLKSEDFPLN